ncbi:hypothetical protein AB0G54_17750 [Streptomyces yokosukanensis]|uniref:hypothetical protein n=1 Tax=Streptomyces yokosukanensis TaxID=67386 RepID=UPI00342CD9DC
MTENDSLPPRLRACRCRAALSPRARLNQMVAEPARETGAYGRAEGDRTKVTGGLGNERSADEAPLGTAAERDTIGGTDAPRNPEYLRKTAEAVAEFKEALEAFLSLHVETKEAPFRACPTALCEGRQLAGRTGT